MMKKIVCLLLAMLCLCSSALAEPRYPDRQGVVTDAAAVLQKDTVRALTDFADNVDDETPVDLYVVTVDFLDGSSLEEYASGLREKWNLHSNDLLILLAVGEDKFGSFGGEDVNRKLSTHVQDKLLSAHFAQPFLDQDYNEAFLQYIPVLAEEIGKAYDEDIDLPKYFGSTQTSSDHVAQWEQYLSRITANKKEEEKTSAIEQITHVDKDTGFSLGKVILTVFLLTVIFGKKDRRRGCGCGCAPFSRLLAAFGLWKLWDNH